MLAHDTCIIQAMTLMYIVQPQRRLSIDNLLVTSIPRATVTLVGFYNRGWKAALRYSGRHLATALSLEILRVTLHKQPDDEAKQPKDSSEDLNSENLDKSGAVSALVTQRYGGATYNDGSAASARAALLPLMPTQTPQIRLHIPTVNPAQNNAYPVKILEGE
jgi:hypothetical protein